MIINFADKVTENIFHGRFSPKGLPLTLQRKVHEELLLINGLPNTMFLRSVPSYGFENLHGRRKGQCSIRVTGKYRICFRYKDGNFFDVEFTDYHDEK